MASTIPWVKTLLLLSLSWLQFLCVDGYFIDKSCKDIENRLKVSMRKIQQSSVTALQELNKDENSDIRELRRFFFRDEDLPRVKNVYHFIQDLTPFGESNEPRVTPPTIYCNLDRFTEVHGRRGDSESDRYLRNDQDGTTQVWDKGYEGCKGGTTLAYTSAYMSNGNKYVMIQLCPWYLDQVTNAKFTNADGTLPKVSGMRSYDPQRDSSNIDPDADVWASRLDFTLLHELVHALPYGYYIKGDPAYDWHPCIALGQKEGCRNPESYAFFVLGVRKIKDEGLKFNKDGMLVSINNKNPKRLGRAIMKLWNA